METIILRIVTETAKKILEYYQGNGLAALHRMAEDIKAISDGMAAEMLKAFIAEADKAITGARGERRRDGARIRQSKVPRELYTALGPLAYERAYFDVEGGHEYILDRILGVDPYERVDAGVSARLVNSAAKVSYGRSAEVSAGGNVSRQTVRNKVMGVAEAAYVPEREANAPEAIHIFADEDHVSLQDGTDAIVPLVAICSGKHEASKGRHALDGPLHAQGYGMPPETLWGYVYALCDEKYGMGAGREVYLYGDGAAWIEAGMGFFPGAVRVLDGFHLKSRMRRLLAGEAGQALAPRARAALARGGRAAFEEAAKWIAEASYWLMPEGKARDMRLKAVKEDAGYILAHWDAAQNIRNPGSIGSCTEAMVSHVLSERFSRNPMGWSKEGLSKMAMIRVYAMNGGRIGPDDVRAPKGGPNENPSGAIIGKYERIVMGQQEKALKGFKDWGLFSNSGDVCMISEKRAGTRVAVDSCGRTRKIG